MGSICGKNVGCNGPKMCGHYDEILESLESLEFYDDPNDESTYFRVLKFKSLHTESIDEYMIVNNSSKRISILFKEIEEIEPGKIWYKRDWNNYPKFPRLIDQHTGSLFPLVFEADVDEKFKKYKYIKTNVISKARDDAMKKNKHFKHLSICVEHVAYCKDIIIYKIIFKDRNTE